MCDTKQPRKGEGGRRNFYTLTKYRKKSSLKLARFSVPFHDFVAQCEEFTDSLGNRNDFYMT